ncbi:MAG: hypothetical protein IKZ53_00180 [Selenomonadaceae bacterium]|nr:hypothetical protein [Selenomonadaceae bacterium]
MADKDKYADEMLTDEELDKVAGGTFEECLYDGDFFKRQIFKSDVDNKGRRFVVCRMAGAFYPQTHIICEAYEEFGVKCIPHYEESVGNVVPNEYFIDGKQVSQGEAHNHVLKIARERGMI